MSRPTTQQIIDRGEYLEPTFDPSTLTVAHLNGILSYHQIRHPVGANKAKLVETFNEEVKSKAKKWKKQRLAREDTNASNDGILDGVSGLPLEPAVTVARRSSRRLSREPSAEVAPMEPPKRRRSAVPSLGRQTPAKAPVVTQPVLIEESESDDEDTAPARKISRHKEEASRSSGRRVSQKFGPGTPDSGWEDNNIFQSGAESSSPVRSPLSKPTIRKASGKKNRASMSAPPDMVPSPSQSPMHVPRSKFEPDLPEGVSQNTRLNWGVPPPSFKQEDISFSAFEDTSGFADISADMSGNFQLDSDDEDLIPNADKESETDAMEEPSAEDTQTLEVSKRLAGHKDAIVPTTNRPRSFWGRFFFAMILIGISAIVVPYKEEVAAIGYCDKGTNSNALLKAKQNERLMIEGCHAQKVTDANPDACPPLPLIPYMQPLSCTPCPVHASCTPTEVICDQGFLLRPPILAQVPWLPKLLNGFPGFGPVALPPSCVEDPTRKRHIGALGKAIDAHLATERGKRLCAGVDEHSIVEGGDAKKWGLPIERLKDNMKRMTPQRMLANFEALFAEAVHELLHYGVLVQGYDKEGNEYLTTEHVSMGWNCRLTVAGRRAWHEWQRSVFGTVAIIILALYGRARRAIQLSEKRRVAQLVQTALDALRNQEMAHHVDPITTPRPYLSSLQLRDYVLQDEHSVPVRRRLWDEVEKVVESNANVRANLEETEVGDEARVWRWVGGNSAGTPLRVQSKESAPAGFAGDDVDQKIQVIPRRKINA